MLTNTLWSYTLKSLSLCCLFSFTAIAFEERNVEVSQCELLKEISESKQQVSNLNIGRLGVSKLQIERNIKKGLVTSDVAYAAIEMERPLHEHAAIVYKKQCSGNAKLANLRVDASKT